MRIIELEQGSQKWLSWRKTVITATDCPAILGSSPWVTPYKCWQRKLGLLEEQKSNEAMERGKILEPEAREQFIKEHTINMTPLVVESTEYDFLGASLDGLSNCGKFLLEIKCGGFNLHNKASQGIIPQYYLDQMQHQLLVTGAEIGLYYSYNGKEGICIKVAPDPSFKDRFIPKAREFLRCIAFCEPPELCEGDYRDMSKELEWKSYAMAYQKTCEEIKDLEAIKEHYRKEILQLCEDQNCMGGGLKVFKTVMRGRVAYDEIPQIKDIDLEKYRKASTSTWKILINDKH